MFLAFDTLSTFVRVDDDSRGVRKTKKFQAVVVCFSILFSALYIDQHGIRRIESCFQRTVKTPKKNHALHTKPTARFVYVQTALPVRQAHIIFICFLYSVLYYG